MNIEPSNNPSAVHLLEGSWARLEGRVQQSREEMVPEQQSEAMRVQHKGLLIETGIRESFDYPSEIIGDSAISGNVEANIPNKSVEPKILDASNTPSEGIVMNMAALEYFPTVEYTGYYQVKGSEEYVQQVSVSVKPAHLREVLMEKGMLESWVKERRGIDTNVPQIIEKINQFSTRMESVHKKINWQEFRQNLLKVNEYYVNNILNSDEDDESNQPIVMVDNVNRAEMDIETVMSTLNNLIIQSKRLTSNIRNVEQKVTTLDYKIDDFYKKYNQTLLDREKAFRDVIAMQTLRDQIERKLTRMESKIQASRAQIRQQGVCDR